MCGMLYCFVSYLFIGKIKLMKSLTINLNEEDIKVILTS